MFNLPHNTKALPGDFFERLSAGDPHALGELMKVYFPLLCKYAEQFTGDSALAEDVVQESFIRFWQHTRTFNNLMQVKAFLFTVTRNRALNMIRSRKREQDKRTGAAQLQPSAVGAMDEEIVSLEYLAEINLFVQQLPERMRQVFLLSFEEGLSIEEIASRLNISGKTVRNQKYNSLLLLRKQFEHLGIPLLVLLSKALK